MDLNDAIHTAECGGIIRDDATMLPEWTIRWDPVKKLLFYHRPTGEQAHKVVFRAEHRASFSWRTVPPTQTPPTLEG